MSEQSKNQKNRRSNLKESKEMNNRQLTQSFIIVLIFHLFFIAIFVYLISPLSKVATITVEGSQDVYEQLIIDESSITIGDYVYKSQQKFEESEKNIAEELVQVSKANMQIEEINQLIIQVEEYETVAYIAKDEGYLRVLENGKVLDDQYSISLGNQLVLSKFEEGQALDGIIEELSKIEKPILNLISEIELVKNRANPLFIHVYMNNGNRILAKIPDFSEKMSFYPKMVQAVESKKGVFDMEAGIYFTPFKDSDNLDLGVNSEEEENLGDLLE